MNPLEICEEDKVFVRKELGLTEEDIKRDVAILKEWITKQPHLPQGIQDDVFFENYLIRCKGRVEKAKRNIDSYYTMKTAWPEMYENLQNCSPSKLACDLLSSLTLTKDRERIINLRLYKNTAEKYNMLDAAKGLFAQLEILNKYDYCSGLHIVADLRNYSLDLLKLTPPSISKKLIVGVAEVYSYRLRGIHYYKPPSYFGLLLNMLKPILKNKFLDRIYLHEDMESLTKMVPKESLPPSLGGEQLPIEELREQWDRIIKDHKEYLEEVQKWKSNEKLRIGKCHLETEMFGIDGTFKKLNID